MIGGTKSQDGGRSVQIFYAALNSKRNPPIFKTTYYGDDKQKGLLETSWISDVKVKGIHLREDEYQGKTNHRVRIIAESANVPFIDAEGNQVAEREVTHVYYIDSLLTSLMGRDLINKFARLVNEGHEEFGISLQQAFSKGADGRWTVPVKNKKGEDVYNVNLYVKDGDKNKSVLPLFANADFCDHELKADYLKAEELCKAAESGKPMKPFWENYLRTMQEQCFAMLQARAEGDGFSVEMEDWNEYKVKYTRVSSSEGDAADEQTSNEAETANEGAADDLPF